MSQITAHDLKDQLIALAYEHERCLCGDTYPDCHCVIKWGKGEPITSGGQTAGHGYDAECECDLVGGDPDCKIQPPYETVEAYISRLQSKIADLLGGDPVPASWPKGAGLHYCEHCQQASHDHEWVQLEAKIAEQATIIERLTEAAIFIAFGKQHTGVIPCPQDYSFYIEPFRKAAQQALVGLDINDEQIDAALSNKRQTD